MSSTSRKHKEDAPRNLRFGIAIISTSRSLRGERNLAVNDISGDIVEKHLVQAGHRVLDRSIIPDDEVRIRGWIESKLRDSEIDVLITSGGTGISRSDVTIETVKELLEKELPGFGEIFRMLSFERIGSAALATRALAGVSRGKPVFCLPGSPDAVELAMTQLLLPEVGHLVKHIAE